MSESEPKECVRCGKISPSRTLVVVRGVWLGPGCARVVRRRERLRGAGPGVKLIVDPEFGWIHGVGPAGVACPDDQEHCLDCVHLRSAVCPLEAYVDSGGVSS